jgi:predicted amidophosphoribosyltransferase
MTYPAATGAPPGFPNCPTCPYLTGGASAICISCAMTSVPPLTGPRCQICSQELGPTGCRNPICTWPSHQRGFGSVSAVSVYTQPLDAILKGFKYEGRWGWSWVFGRLILGWLNLHVMTAARYTLVLANPSFTGRQPYQHVEMILAAAATEDIHRRWPIYPRGLTKPVDTPPSARGSWSAKQLAAQAHANALRTMVPLSGAQVLLVDDIFTTGAQLDAVGRHLRTLGAVHVDGLVLARAPWTRPV